MTGEQQAGPTDAGAQLRRVADDPRYRALVRRRSRFAWTLTAIMLVVYFGYILLIAFDRDFLAQRIGGEATTLGIPIGVAVILVGILLTGIYVRVTNRTFDPRLRQILSDGE